jgi:hypothetical protein
VAAVAAAGNKWTDLNDESRICKDSKNCAQGGKTYCDLPKAKERCKADADCFGVYDISKTKNRWRLCTSSKVKGAGENGHGVKLFTRATTTTTTTTTTPTTTTTTTTTPATTTTTTTTPATTTATTAYPDFETCCDPTNPLHISKTTTCTVEVESCTEWVDALAVSKWHYQGGAASKKAADLASRVCATSGNRPHYWIKVKHANPNLWENTASDNFRCARGGDKATPAAAASCTCCECKNNVAHMKEATKPPTAAVGDVVTTTKLATPFKIKGITAATFTAAAQAGVIQAVAKSAGVHHSAVTLANIQDTTVSRRLSGVTDDVPNFAAVSFDVIIAVTNTQDKTNSVELLDAIKVGGNAAQVRFANLMVEDMKAAVFADSSSPPALKATMQAFSDGAQASSIIIDGATTTESKTETITAAEPDTELDMSDKGEQNCGLAHTKACATQWLPNDGCSMDTTLAKPFNDNKCWPCGDDNELACKFKFQDNQGCGPDDTLAKGGDASDGSHEIGDHHGFNEVNPNPHPAGKCWTCGGDNQPRCDTKYASNNGCKDGTAAFLRNKCFTCGGDNQPQCVTKYASNNGCQDGHSGTHHAKKCFACTRSNVNCE